MSIDHNIIIFYFSSRKIISFKTCSLWFIDKAKCLFISWKLGSIKKYKYQLILSLDTFGWYLFQIIVLLKPDFNYSRCFALEHKVLYQLLKILWLELLHEQPITHFSEQFRSTLTSQLIKGISRVPQKLLRYFNRTIFYFVLNISVIALASAKLVIVLSAAKAGSSIQYCHKNQDVF